MLRCAARRATPRRFASRALSSDAGFFELTTEELIGTCGVDALDVQASPATHHLLSAKVDLGGPTSQIHHLVYNQSYADRADGAPIVCKPGHLSRLGFEAPLEIPSALAVTKTETAAFNEATKLLNDCGLPGAREFMAEGATSSEATNRGTAWELRTYQLVLGYDAVPQFLKLYGAALPDKLEADTTGKSELVTLLYSDCGPLNRVHELWRHDSLQGAQQSRAASRAASRWRTAIGEIAKSEYACVFDRFSFPCNQSDASLPSLPQSRRPSPRATSRPSRDGGIDRHRRSSIPACPPAHIACAQRKAAHATPHNAAHKSMYLW